jgi:hypothetical protein
MRFLSLGVLVAGALGLLSACGGSSNSSLSYSAFSNAANKICQDENVRASAAGTVTSTADAANAAVIARLADIQQAGIGKLKALKGPTALESARDAFVSDLSQATAIAKSIADAAKSGDQSRFVSLGQQLTAGSTKRHNDGAQLGAPACSRD